MMYLFHVGAQHAAPQLGAMLTVFRGSALSRQSRRTLALPRLR
jgi:hypothetical protein